MATIIAKVNAFAHVIQYKRSNNIIKSDIQGVSAKCRQIQTSLIALIESYKKN